MRPVWTLFVACGFLALSTAVACGDDSDTEDAAAGTPAGSGGDGAAGGGDGGGMGGSGGNEGGEDCNNGADDDGDGAIDCADDDCAEVTCVPEPPPGWHGIAHFADGDACPDEWPTLEHTGGVSPQGDPATCGACSCGSLTGDCNVLLPYYVNDASCSNIDGTFTPQTSCTSFPSASFADWSFRKVLTPTNLGCPASGGQPSTTPPSYGGTGSICTGAAPAGEGCEEGSACVSASEGPHCIYRDTLKVDLIVSLDIEPYYFWNRWFLEHLDELAVRLGEFVDLRVVLIGAKNDGVFDWCVSPPLGSGACPADDQPPSFTHLDVAVDGDTALQVVLSEYDSYKDALRGDALKQIVVASHGASNLDAAAFVSAVEALDPSFDGFGFHAVAPSVGWPGSCIGDPTQWSPCCNYPVAVESPALETLSTDGLFYDACDIRFTSFIPEEPTLVGDLSNAIVESAAACPASFPVAEALYRGAPADDRGCTACECEAGSATCSGGAVGVYSGTGCGGTVSGIQETCTPLGDVNVGSYRIVSEATVSGDACTPTGGEPDGEVRGAEPIFLCCLP